jgi:tetratricopeptide (TPR) repeat protein
MSCSSCTTPVSAARKKTPARTDPGRAQTAWTWFLLAVWTGLMIFAAISTVNPPWFRQLSRPGIEAEARNYVNYGDARLRAKQYKSAAAQYLRALEINPNQSTARVNLGTAYIQAGMPEQGAACLREVLEQPAGSRLKSTVYYNLGEMYEKLQRPDEALENYELAAAQGMRPDMVYKKIGMMRLALNRLEGAREAFERVLAAQLDPATAYREMLARSEDVLADMPEQLAVLAKLRADFQGLDSLAPFDLELIRQLQQTDREIAKTYNKIGYVSVQLNQLALAETRFEKSLEIWPGNLDAARNLESVRKNLGK